MGILSVISIKSSADMKEDLASAIKSYQYAKNDLIADFTRVFGVGDKLANMTLSFLLCSDPERKSMG